MTQVRRVEGLASIPITYVSIKPSPWLFTPDVSDKAVQASTAIHWWIKNSPTHNKLYFLNIWNKMVDEQGKPLDRYFVGENGALDEKHINGDGYKLWAMHLRHYLSVMLQVAPSP
ncbi:hypothetical protein EON83_10810 [bacterium]|nr:MAG: hypothetical protein EON83_10810 [bacterium]